jgi:RNA-directed DNA polymerase
VKVKEAVAERFNTVGLEMHPEKTKIVYCKDSRRRGRSEHTSFDFLGYTFRGRLTKGRKGLFIGFTPAISAKAFKAISRTVRGWHLNRYSWADLAWLAELINVTVRGWVNYYGAFHRSKLSLLADRIDAHLTRWVMRKYKRFRHKPSKARQWLNTVKQYQPNMFAHWQIQQTH